MAKIEELQNEITRLYGMLAQAGIFAKPEKHEHASDYIPFGSEKHAAFLGVVEVSDVEQAKRDGFTVYTSPNTAKQWRLEDEIGALKFYPGVDPNKAALLVLRQKVYSLESGVPPIPSGAPDMFTGE